MNKEQEVIFNLVKAYNKSKTGPYIVYHYKDNLLITCFTEADRIREVVLFKKEAEKFIEKVVGVR